MLTIFSIPKPFRGDAERLQMNAIRSWRASNPAARIVLCGDDEGVAGQAATLGVEHLADVAVNEFGTPLISSVFRQVITLFPSDHFLYLNCDILLLQEVEPIARQIPFRDFLGVARRITLHLRTCIDFARSAWRREIEAGLIGNLVFDTPLAIDLFMFRSSGSWTALPDFAVGRPCWDNWMIFTAKQGRIPVVDLTPVLRIVHQHHGYDHIRQRTGERWAGPEASRNRHLASKAFDQQGRTFSTAHADYRLESTGLRRNLGFDALRAKWHTLPLLYPVCAPVLEAGQQVTLWIGKRVREWR